MSGNPEEEHSGAAAPRTGMLALRHVRQQAAWLLALTAALVAVLLVSILRASASADAAADGATNGVTWQPGDVSWAIQRDGRCLTSQSASVTAKNPDDARALFTALRTLPAKTDLPANSGIKDIHANVSDPGTTNVVMIDVHAYVDASQCQAASTAQ
ncbi:MAG TPA: hypothetical protein VI248_04865 [Kineosporiaceae bacterium]